MWCSCAKLQDLILLRWTTEKLIQLPKPETNAPICQDVDITVGAVGIPFGGIKFPLRTDVYSLVPDTVFVTRLVVGPGF